jgi:TM2 domain-containing membrane protein YozV
MNLKLFLIIIFLNVLVTNCYSQNSFYASKKHSLRDLRSELLYSEIRNEFKVKSLTAKSKKSPALALLFSLILPGAGHFYLNRMDVGKYFLGVDAASWLGLATLNIYGDNVRDDSRTFSREHADLADIDNKNDDFFANVGNYDNIYEYNNDKLIRGEYAMIYDVNQYFWNWDNTGNRDIFETQRKNSERIYNSRIIFGSILVANRIISGISSFLIANKDIKNTSLNIQPELMYKSDYTFDGIKINVSKNFNF